MRVLFFTDNLRRGGTEKHIARLAEGLRREYNYDPAIMAMEAGGDWYDYLRERGIPVVVRPFAYWVENPWRDAKKLLKLGWAMRQHRPDILVCVKYHNSVWGCLAAAMAGLRRRAAFRVGLAYEDPAHRLPDPLARLGHRATSHYIANSHAIAHSTERVEGIPAGRFTVIHQSVEVPPLAPQAGWAFREQHGIPPDAVVFGLLANFSENKNHLMLVEATACITEQYPQAVTVLAGGDVDPGYRQRVEAAVMANSLAGRVVLTGTLSDTSGFLNAIDVGVLVSRAEGFSNAVLEYMAHAAPVIGTRVGGNVEAIAEAERGLLVESGDVTGLAQAMRWMITHPEERRVMGVQARAHVAEHHTQPAELHRWHTFFQGATS